MGLKKDRDTVVAFPSESNCCYRQSKCVRVLLEYQESTCLTDQFVECPVYRGAGKVSLSKENREPDPRRLAAVQRYGMVAVLLILMLAAGWLVYQYRHPIKGFVEDINGPGPFISTYIPPTFVVTNARVEAYQPLVLGTPVVVIKTSAPSQAAEAAAQATAAPTPDGIENGRGLVIHDVTAGENLDILAETYYTTAEAILDINYKMTPPLMEGRTVVIPEGIVHTEKFPKFEIKRIPDKTKVSYIVEKYECDLALFQQYNRSLIVSQAGTDYILAKQKVLIPRARAKQSNP